MATAFIAHRPETQAARPFRRPRRGVSSAEPPPKGPAMPPSRKIDDYILASSLREAPALQNLREENETRSRFNMQLSADAAQFLQMLLKLMGAKRGIELGTFTGYSAMAMAMALPPDGKMVCCDVSVDSTAIARRHWANAGIAGKIDLRIGPALDTLDALIAAGEKGRFDFMLIDADKPAYDSYYERGLTLLRAGGLIAIDNVLWGGSVAEPSGGDASTRALRALNKKIAKDERVDVNMLPLGDGLSLVRKR
jgi:predicted O-methyltransferase YrrM